MRCSSSAPTTGSIPAWDGCLPSRWGCSRAARAECGARCRRLRSVTPWRWGWCLLAAGAAQIVMPLDTLKIVVGAMLVTLGVYRLWRHRHPRFGGMQVGFRDLTMWSFLMASAHGAGFMVLPFVMGMPAGVSAAGANTRDTSLRRQASGRGRMRWRLASTRWRISQSTALMAWVVYRKLGWRCFGRRGSTWTGCGPARWWSQAPSCCSRSHGARIWTSARGSIRAVLRRAPQWRWGPVTRPVAPTVPTISPAPTRSPAVTSIFDRCASTE